MVKISLIDEQRKQLVEIIAGLNEVRTTANRIAFLENCGLQALQGELQYDTSPRDFTAALIRLCQDKGTFTPTGEPALASVLTFLRDDILQGRETEREFVSALLQQANPNVARASLLRRRNPDFRGRTEALERLTAALRDGRTVHLQGMGGAGKTELALQLAARVKEDFPGPALQVELQPDNTPANATSLLSQVIVSLNPVVRLPATLNELQQLAHSLMNGKEGILLLDNAAAPEQIHPLREAARGWAVLVTSRARFALLGSVLESIGELTEKEAIGLLTTLLKNYGRTITSEAGAALAVACHRLPLTLTVTAAYLGTDVTVSVEKYLELLRNRPKDGFRAEGYDDVYNVLGLSIERLAREDPQLCERWHLLTQIPVPFDAKLAAGLWGELHEGKHPSVTALRRDTTITELGELVRLALLTYDEVSKQYRLHDLWKTYATEVSPLPVSNTAIDRAIRCHALTVLNLGSATHQLFNKGQQVKALTQFDAIWEHLNSAWNMLHTAEDATAAYFLSMFTGWLSSFLALRLATHELISYIEIALAAARRRNDKEEECIHLGNLGLRYANLGDVRKGIIYYEQALTIANECGDRRNQSVNLVNLGSAYRDLGNIKESISYYEEALIIIREVNAKDGEGIALGGLGIAHQDLGDIPKAIFYYEQALTIAREIGDKRGESARLGGLGIAYQGLGDINQAISYYKESLKIAFEIGDKSTQGTRLSNLGNLYRKLGQLQEAILTHQKGLSIIQEIGLRNSEADLQWELAYDYVALKDYCVALGYAHSALILFEATENSDAIKVRADIERWETAQANSSTP